MHPSLRPLFLALVVPGFLLGACKGSGASGSGEPMACASTATCSGVPHAEAVASARSKIGPFKRALLDTMQTAMKAGGPTSVVEVCGAKASAIATEHSTEGYEIGRTSHKLRNPRNTPRPWMKDGLRELSQAQKPVEGQYRLVSLPEGRLGYLETLPMAPLCLGCHGGEVEPGLKKILADRYPKDEATGFAEGDVRGVVWVEWKPKK